MVSSLIDFKTSGISDIWEGTAVVATVLIYTDQTKIRITLYEIDPRRVTFSFALSFALIYAVASALTSTR